MGRKPAERRQQPPCGGQAPWLLRCLVALLLLLALPVAAATTAHEGERAHASLGSHRTGALYCRPCLALATAAAAARPPAQCPSLWPGSCRGRDHAAAACPAAQRGTALGGVPPRLEPHQQCHPLPLGIRALQRRRASDLAVSVWRRLQGCPWGEQSRGGLGQAARHGSAVAAAAGRCIAEWQRRWRRQGSWRVVPSLHFCSPQPWAASLPQE